ncbi:hypothetical protein Droror1_Dr00000830 [Drosera rotundifolia]
MASFEEFSRQATLMNSCTRLWKELCDHYASLEQDLIAKSESLRSKIQSLDDHTERSLKLLEKREGTIEGSVQIAVSSAEKSTKAAIKVFEGGEEEAVEEVDDDEGLLLKLKSFCVRMDHEGFWRFVTVRKKELDVLRAKIPIALENCIDPPRFVLESISEVFPVDKRGKSERVNDLGWACVLILESLIPVVVDPVIGKERLLVTPRVREHANEIAETWKNSLEERGGIENVKTPDVHTFLQHLVTFGIVRKDDVSLYRKLVVGSAWRKQMPKLAVSLGLGDEMSDMIEELISRGQQVDAVHFTHEVGLVDKFPTVPLLKAFLKDAKKAAAAITEDPNNTGRSAYLATRKEQSALKAVIKCIEEYKLEAQFPAENLKKRLEQLEKTKTDKKRPAAAPANKRTRASNNGPMPPAKAGRLTNAYVSSFPAPPPFVRSPSHMQYPAGVAPYAYDRPAVPAIYGSRSPSYVYSPEAVPSPLPAGSYPGAPINYPVYGALYGAPSYGQAYY